MTVPLTERRDPVVAAAASRVSTWRVAQVTAVAVAVLAAATFLGFVLRDGGSVLFTVLMAWFASIAMEPAVVRLSARMRRGAATGLVMGAIALFAVLFMMAFGRLLLSQIATMLKAIPGLVTSVLDLVNSRFGTDLSVTSVLTSINLTPEQVGSYSTQVVGGALSVLGSVIGGLFSLFTLGLLTFYLSADAPRLRRWIAGLFPPRGQSVFLAVWQTTMEKTGGYVSARAVLALINGTTTAIVFWIIGMPSWLALGIWTGLIAQFVPTIGTYLSIVLPVVVGLQSGRPVIGVIALAWAVVYQQVENLTLEPRISARATDVHLAVAFTAVLLGSALFGVAGALLAVPVAAVLLSLAHVYVRRHELVPALDPVAQAPPTGRRQAPTGNDQTATSAPKESTAP